ncbi:MAG: hypothetical protein ACOYW9_02575 [Deinococcota bacterium]|nr:hypothetical protein [Allomeiothermus silvanus]
MFKNSGIARYRVFIGLAAFLAGCASAPIGQPGGIGAQGQGSFLGAIHFSLGSLIAEGNVVLGNVDVVVTLSASGIPVVSCTNQGGTQAPGQNPPKVSGAASQLILHDAPIVKNGRSPFEVEANAQTTLSAKRLGCPNNNWTANIDFVFWDRATLTLTDNASGAVLEQRDFSCVTTRNPDSVTCIQL